MTRHRWPLAVAATVAAGLALLAALGGDAAAPALRALAVVAILALGAALARRRRLGAGAPEAVSSVERHGHSRDAGVALVSAEGRRLLVGFGPAGVRLLAELRHAGETEP